jgi:hypothetical protein
LVQQIKNWINAGLIPAATANSYYVVYFRPSSSETGFIRASDPTPFSCSAMEFSTSSVLDDYTPFSSTLLADTVTEPQGLSWTDSSNHPPGTVGANNSGPTRLNGYLVNQVWSNLHGGPAVTPGL